jgi:hypothetical protein
VAGLAERRYRAVDPDNRLVARGLERAWEESLRAHEMAKAELARRENDRPSQGRNAAVSLHLVRISQRSGMRPRPHRATGRSCLARGIGTGEQAAAHERRSAPSRS